MTKQITLTTLLARVEALIEIARNRSLKIAQIKELANTLCQEKDLPYDASLSLYSVVNRRRTYDYVIESLMYSRTMLVKHINALTVEDIPVELTPARRTAAKPFVLASKATDAHCKEVMGKSHPNDKFVPEAGKVYREWNEHTAYATMEEVRQALSTWNKTIWLVKLIDKRAAGDRA